MSPRLTRRFVLRGTGASLALPLLPSLLTTRFARAQAVTPRPAYVHFATHHGGIWARNLFPAPARDAVSMRYAGRDIRRFALEHAKKLSPVLDARGALTPKLLRKLTLIQGVDIPFYIGHHTGGHLGNFARNDGNAPDGVKAQSEAQRRTIDQIMAYSPAFYPDLPRVKERALVLGARLSYNFADPVARTGALQEQAVIAPTANALFQRLFSAPPATQAPLVDRVADNYRRLLTNPRLSQADKERVEQHVERVADLERRLSVTVPATAPPSGPYAASTMQDVSAQLDPTAHAGFFQTQNDLIVAALTTGASRVAVVRVDPDFSAWSGDWHSDVAHHAHELDAEKQGVLMAGHRAFFAKVFLDLASKLDAVDAGDGSTLLDHSLLAWTQECGSRTHESQGIPIVTFGSAGGALVTGQALDYRDLTACFNPAPSEADKRYAGLLWHQWLGTALSAMGVPRTEWENPASNLGYPDWKFANVTLRAVDTAQAYPDAVWAAAGDGLPWFVRGA